MENERLWTLLGKKLSGVATKEELQELQLLLLAYDEDEVAIGIIQRMWENKEKDSESSDVGEDPIRDRIDAALGPANSIAPAGRTRRWLIGAIAAAVLLVIGFITVRSSKGRSEEDQMLVLYTRKRSHSNLKFPDGTEVVLNENSRIAYNANFGTVKREIILQGEAYFDVATNPGMPLIIHAKNVDIRVLGTALNVKAYPTDKDVETSLITGKVEVSSTQFPKQKILLRPNEKVIISGPGQAVKDQPAPEKKATGPPDETDGDTASAAPPAKVEPLVIERSSRLIPEIAWMYRKLVFNQEAFETVAEKMERWYGVTFYFEDESLKKEVFTGSFDEETLEEALKALQFSYPFSYVIKNKEVFIKRKK